MAIGATSDLFLLLILSDCSVMGTTVGLLPSLWGQGLGGCISAWVSSAGGSARMALVVNRFSVPECWDPKPDALLFHSHSRHEESWKGLKQVHGEYTDQT